MQLPTLTYEEQYWQQGISPLAGLDEAGMGAFAGPVAAAAAIFDPVLVSSYSVDELKLIRDSKTLTATQRERAAAWIKEHAQAWAVGEASVDEITQLNIRRAAHLAMRRAIDVLIITPALLLLDGTPANIHPTIPTVNIIDGDAISFSIAAASILAKVHRDEIMQQLELLYPGYGFAGNKGYGSLAHKAALQELGVTPAHRPTYAPVAAVLTKNNP